MGAEIRVDDADGIVEIRFLQPVPHSEHLKAREDLLEICRVRNIHKILVDARALVGDSPSTDDLFDFGESWAELARRAPVLLAGVLPQDASMREWWRFGDAVTANRGFETRAFDDIDRARAWLRSA